MATQFERMFPYTVESSVRCPSCNKKGKSIRAKDNDEGTLTYCCGKCGENWKIHQETS